MEKFIECDVYVADYTEYTEKIGQVPFFDEDKDISTALLAILYPFSEMHYLQIKWKNDIKYLAEEICSFVKDIYDSKEFGHTNHAIEDLFLEGIKVVSEGKETVIGAYIGS